MKRTGRREFLRSSSAAALGLCAPSAATAVSRQNTPATTPATSATIQDTGATLQATARTFSLRYTRQNDRLELFDTQQRVILSAPLFPVIVQAGIGGGNAARHAVAAASATQTLHNDRIRFTYTLADAAGTVAFDLRITPDALWIDPIQYTASRPAEIVSLHYFAAAAGQRAAPALQASFLVVPGMSEGSSVSPIQSDEVGLHETVWLGRGSAPTGLNQQWGLPVHYCCGLSKHAPGPGTRDLYSRGVSAAFACGLASLPNGDLFLTLDQGRSSLWVDYRSDLWHHLRTPGTLELGATLCLTVGPQYRDAIHAYYAALRNERIISIPLTSPRKLATMLSPQFCTWGAQVVRDARGDKLSETFLEDIYAELRRSGMQATLFSIDDKWEGAYGGLVHDTARLPHFEQFLDRVRGDGHRIGLWTALMRCEDPASLGLTLSHMLHAHDGTPLREGSGYFLLDFTQPLVATVLQKLARTFMQRYRPDLVKFDFGYELPNLSQAAPADRAFMGERLLSKGLATVIPALREVNPDVVVMYYNLSPLYLSYFDLHGLDDIYQAYREFSYEANRRLFFSGLLGSLGVPTYGSSGYDWASAPEIWFDSAASGTIGSLNDFTRDEAGEQPTPELIARYNGVSRALRQTRIFDVLAIGGPQIAPAQGAHAASWVRLEDGKPVLLARRPSVAWSDLPSTLSAQELAFADSAVADFPVLLSSATADALTASTSLVLVPFGAGPVAIRSTLPGPANVLVRYLGGATATQTAAVHGGWLRIIPAPRNGASPIESVHISFG